MLFCLVSKARERPLLWVSGALGVLGLAGMSRLPWLNPGCLAAGVLASIAPLPAAALSGAALEAAGFPAMTAAMCLAAMVRMLPIREQWRRLSAPGLGCLLALLLHPDGSWAALPCVALGGVVGALIPWHFPPLSRNTGTAAAQVRLEQAAQGLDRLHRMLLTLSPPPIDRETLAAKLRENACADCSFRANCTDQEAVNADLFRQNFSFHCRKTGRVLRELRRAQEQLRFLSGQRAKQAEYRGALARQYGMLSAYLQITADRLPIRERPALAKYHVQVSARSRSREAADGDRCESFPGTALRYYIVLCDGMGTGLGAEDEARSAVQMLKQMLTAGLPASCALGTMNDCMALRGRAGAVTVDLAEIRLDTGQAVLYKWGAARSLLLRRGALQTVGDITAPPGLRIGNSRENKTRISLSRSEMLVMLSDGITLPDDPDLLLSGRELAPGELADQILQTYVSASDDATAVVIRLQPTTLAT